ncbi:MAG: phosphoadenylyl-sulfate reductase [Candidatus Omnitrophica bacterium]|nr:phosphoadenylyl-sulfate reductase [Candidatus Omnitrophota bacterium]
MDKQGNTKEFQTWASSCQSLSAFGVIDAVLKRFSAGRVAFASSLGAEDQVITHLLQPYYARVSVFTIDTGRLPQETYDLIQRTSEAYGLRYEVLLPDQSELVPLMAEHGMDLFRKSVELRKACCHARKVAPLKKKLATLNGWICGLRRSQAITRTEVQAVEWDEHNALVKVNPLVDWSEADIWAYIKKNNVPYNALHDKGYPSIGCSPCARAVKPGEDVRAGRWWWESPEHKECGLHGRAKKG